MNPTDERARSLPCPFCGSAKTHYHYAYCARVCAQCHAIGPGGNSNPRAEEEAIERWNRRAALATGEPLTDELSKAVIRGFEITEFVDPSRASKVGDAAAPTETDALRGFAQAMMEDWPEGAPDGFELQDLAIKFGLIEEAEPRPTEPCAEGCWCAEYFSSEDWADGVTCYRKTPLLTGKATPPEIPAAPPETDALREALAECVNFIRFREKGANWCISGNVDEVLAQADAALARPTDSTDVDFDNA